MENWKPVVGYEGIYSVSDRGRVRSEARTAPSFAPRSRTGARVVSERVLKPETDKDGYQRVVLSAPAFGKHHFYVHALVLAAFVGPRPSSMQALHGDGDPANCCLKNLRYGTQRDNSADAARHGTLCRGERHWWAKLTAEEVLHIRTSKTASSAIAMELGVTRNNINAIRSGRTWKALL